MKAYLRERYPTEDSAKIGEVLGVTRTAVMAMAHQLRVVKSEQREKMVWTPEKIAYLEESYATESMADMARHLNCTEAQIKWRAQRMGLRREKKKAARMFSEEREVWFGRPDRIGKNRNPVTDATLTLVCSCALSGYTQEQTAMLTERSKEQVAEVLEECKRTGYYAMVKERQDEMLCYKE